MLIVKLWKILAVNVYKLREVSKFMFFSINLLLFMFQSFYKALIIKAILFWVR